jgi:hypothetical protein
MLGRPRRESGVGTHQRLRRYQILRLRVLVQSFAVAYEDNIGPAEADQTTLVRGTVNHRRAAAAGFSLAGGCSGTGKVGCHDESRERGPGSLLGELAASM